MILNVIAIVIAAVAALIVLVITTNPYAGVLVGAFVLIGLELFKYLVVNNDGSMNLRVPYGLWVGTPLVGYFFFGNSYGVSGYVNGNPCNLYMGDGQWHNGCQSGDTYDWLAVNLDGRLEAAVAGVNDGNIYSIAQTCNPNCGWTGWLGHGGGIFSSRPAMGLDPNGELEALAISSSGSLYENYQNAYGSHTWVGWAYLGCCFQGAPSISENADGRLEAAVRGTNNNIYHYWETSPSGVWNGVGNLGCCFASSPTIISNADGRLEIFVMDFYKNLLHFWQTCAGCGWSSWSNLGCCLVGNPSAARFWDGSLGVFGVGTDGAVYYQRQQPTGAWSGWQRIGGNISSSIVVRANYDSRLEVFGTDSNNHLWHAWENSPGASWSSFSDLGCCVHGTPDAQENTNGIMEAFAVGTDQSLYHKWQISPGNSSWSGWSSLGGGVKTP